MPKDDSIGVSVKIYYFSFEINILIRNKISHLFFRKHNKLNSLL